MKSKQFFMMIAVILSILPLSVMAQGKTVKGVKYDFVGEYHEGLAKVSQNDKWGFIDKNGKVIIPLKYEKVFNYSPEGFTVAFGTDKSWLIDKTGKEFEIPLDKFTRAAQLEEGNALVGLTDDGWKTISVNEEGKVDVK